MKSRGLELGQFLNEQRALGTSDSEGQFTVSHSNAARKLARFSLPRPYAWASKVIQAACGWNADEVSVRQRRTLTSIYLRLDDAEKLPTEEELVEVLLSDRIGGGRPIDDFCIALRSLVEQTRLSFLVVIEGEASPPRPVYAGPHLTKMKESHRLASRYRLGRGITLTVAHIPADETETPLLVGYRYAKKIIDELEKYCFLCTVPLKIGKDRRDGPLESGRFAPSKDFKPLLISGVKDGESLALPAGFEEKKMSLFTHPQRALRTYHGNADFSSVVVVGVDLEALLNPFESSQKSTGSLNWVDRGVVVYELGLPVRTRCLRCEFFLNADGLKRDLTGFKLLESEEKKQRETGAVRALADLVCSTDLSSLAFRADLDESSPSDDADDARAAKRRSVKRFLKGSSAGVVLSVLNPPLGASLALGGVIAALVPRKDNDHASLAVDSEKFRRVIREDTQMIAEHLLEWNPQDSDGSGIKVEFSS